VSQTPDLGTIVRAAIHPAIGVARVGNSPDVYFLAPEVSEPLPQAPGFYRDGSGALKRQAQRFRVYGYDAQGRVVAELTAANAQITWSAHLANQKAAWYQFVLALDIPESVQQNIVCPLRNADVAQNLRHTLVIDGGNLSVSGCDQQSPGLSFNGSFMGEPVCLGELRTDEAGRLIVLGGLGHSDSPVNAPLPNFANNDGWHDDTADGPVRATVNLGGVNIPVDPAWVVVAPPNYGPDLKTVRTLHDLLFDLFNPVDPKAPPTPSFTQDILPIFRRMSALQWVNGGFFEAFGHGAPLDFVNEAFLSWASQPLHMPIDLYAERRQQIANAFRDLDRDGYSPTPFPWLYSDAINLPYPKNDNAFLALTTRQLAALQSWAQGQFIGDYAPQVAPPRRIDEVALPQQPAMLDRAALEFCLADAFHPGCEVTWPIRHRSMYLEPPSVPGTGQAGLQTSFRIRPADEGSTMPDYGPTLTTQNFGGTLQEQWPGGLTRWMAVPWQTDTASCLSGYVPEYDPLLPTFWPARVPNHVLDEPEYRQVVDTRLPIEVRRAAFRIRRSWPGVLPGRWHEEQVAAMVTLFPQMGIVEQRPGVVGEAEFPSTMLVARLPDFPGGPPQPPIGGGGIEPPAPPAPPVPPASAPPPASLEAAASRSAALPRAPQGRGIKPSRDGTYMGRFKPPG